MYKRSYAIALALAALVMTSGCAVNQTSAQLIGNTDLSKVKTLYVVKRETDTRGTDEVIKANLAKRGYTVTGGEAKVPPYATDAVITYIDKWFWDITMYMLELTITVRDPGDVPIATGNSLHTSLTRKSPAEMVDEVMTNILAAKK
jgi:hypothetical protein